MINTIIGYVVATIVMAVFLGCIGYILLGGY